MADNFFLNVRPQFRSLVDMEPIIDFERLLVRVITEVLILIKRKYNDPINSWQKRR